jgi:BirA family transcriptional regulator, biotin operon repressor / biotin---[acetyl-CoA-carboxylase] ligase
MEIVCFDEIDSTNEEVTRRALDGAPDGLWVMAERQTAGRGRRGRAWVSEPGNLYCTGLVRIRAGEPPAQQLSFLAALAARDALEPHVPDIRLKWPNDLLVDGAKLAGILLEAGGAGSGGLWVAVGIGINLAHHPNNAERPATSVKAQTGRAPDPETVLLALVKAFDQLRLLWASQGFAPIRAAWLAQASGLGEPLEARLGQETLRGVFAGLDSDGALLLLLESGETRAIHAGEVFGI